MFNFLVLTILVTISFFINADEIQLADSHGPISIMGDHMHKKGELMFSYRLGKMNMNNVANGTKKVSTNLVMSSPNGASNNFVYCGFKPAWILVRRTDSAGYETIIMDNKRSPFNEMDDWLYANSNAAEDTNGALDFLANGFAIKQSHSYFNASGGTYFFMAFAEEPLVSSNGKPATAR